MLTVSVLQLLCHASICHSRGGKYEYGVLPDNIDTVLSYPDAESISDYARLAALNCQTTGIIAGRAGEVLIPQSTATRAEVAAIIQRFVKNVFN